MAECTLKSNSNAEQSNANDGTNKKCIPCESLDTSSLLTRQYLEERLVNSLPLWTLQEFSSTQTLYLSKTFVAKNFQAALDSINKMGAIAERENHHPDFHLTNYRNIEVCLYTHSVGGITENDLAMCKTLDDEVEIVYSPKWLKEHPEAAK